MKINFYNYDLIFKRMSRNHLSLIKFIDEQKTNDFEHLNLLIKEKFNTYGPEFGHIIIDTKTIAILKLTKEEIKFLLKEDNNTIYNKDFKKIIQRINTQIKNKPNTDLHMLEMFFKFSIRAKSEYITLYSKNNNL
jgi:hypothetical protein